MSESALLQRIRLKATELGWRLLRNNIGLGWGGKPCVPCMQRLTRIRYGLCVGSSDLIGWRPVKITQQMVGRTLAVFLAIEAKTPTGYTTPDQEAFLKAVNEAGGDGRVIRNEADL
jgi:hypothetical protein